MLQINVAKSPQHEVSPFTSARQYDVIWLQESSSLMKLARCVWRQRVGVAVTRCCRRAFTDCVCVSLSCTTEVPSGSVKPRDDTRLHGGNPKHTLLRLCKELRLHREPREARRPS